MQQPFAEFAHAGELAGGECVLFFVPVVGEADAEVIPGLVGDIVLEVIKRSRQAVADFSDGLCLGKGFVPRLFLRHRFLLFHLLLDLRQPVDVELPPVNAVVEIKGKCGPAVVLVHQQGFFVGRSCQQQLALIAVGLDVVVLEAVALVHVVPVQLAGTLLRNHCGRAFPAVFNGPLMVLLGPCPARLVPIQRPHQTRSCCIVRLAALGNGRQHNARVVRARHRRHGADAVVQQGDGVEDALGNPQLFRRTEVRRLPGQPFEVTTE